jgi:predicted membrane protein
VCSLDVPKAVVELFLQNYCGHFRCLARNRSRFSGSLKTGKGLILIYSSTVRKIAVAFVLACIAASTVVGLLHEPKTPLLAWTSLAVVAVVNFAVLATNRNPKRDAVLFLVSGLSSGVFMGASTVGFPGSLPMWLWTIGTMGIGMVALIVDAEAVQSKSVNRL